MKMSKPISSVPTTNNPPPWGYLFIQTRLRQFIKLYDEKFTVGSSNKSKFQIVTNQKVLSSTLLRLTNRKDQSKMFLEVHGYQGTVFLNEKQIRRGHKIALKAGDRILIKTTIQNLVFVFLTTQFVQEFTQKHSLQIKEKTDYFKQIERKENEICQQIRKRLNELILHHSSLNPQIQFEDIEYPIDPLVIRQIQFTALLNLRDFSIKKSALFPNQSAKTLFVGPSGSQILQETLIRAISDTFKAVNITISEDDFLDLFKREKKNDIQENESNVPVIYKFGDIVKYVGPQNYPNIAIQDQTEGPTAGDRGIVVSTFQDNHKSPIVGVLFQNEIPGGSDLGGICEKGTKCGFFFNQDELRPFHEEEIDTRALTIQTLLEYIEKNIAKSTPLVLCIKDIDKWVSKSNEVKQILKDRLEELEKNRLIMIIGSIANNKLNNKLNLSKNSESSRGSLTSGLSIFLPPNPNSRSAFGDNSRLNSSSTKSYGNTIEMIGGSLGVGTGGDSSSSVFKFLVELFPNTIFLQPIEKPSKISFWKDCIEKDNLSIQKNYNEILLERTLKKYQLSTSNLLILGNLLTQKRFTEEEMDMIVGFSFLSKYEKLFNKKIDKKNIIQLEKEFNSIVNKKSRKRLMNETKNNINIENNLNEKENQEKEIEIEIEIENENKEIEKTIEKENDTRNDNNQNHKIRKTRKNLDLKNINQNIDLNLNEEKKELPEKKNEMQEKNNNFSLINTQNQKKFKYIYKESHSIIESKHLEYGIHILNKFYGKDRTTRLLETVKIDNEYEHQFLSEVIVPEEINIKFDQIGALHKIKKTLDDLVILPLRRPELFQRGNLLKACKGILLFGPPGTGKTMLAKAVATESGANFINVSMTKISSKWFGEGEKYAKAVFTLATKLAPSIIFIDEVDSFLNRRQTSHEHEASRKIKNTFMTEWDGLGMSDTERVIVLAATNRPFDLDEAVLRRLPRRLFVPMPNKEARKKILQTILSGEALEKNFDFDQLAEETDGYSGSDLKNLSISAAYEPIRDFLKKEKTLNPKLKKNEKKKSKVLTKKSSNTKFLPFRSFFDLDQDQNSQNNNSNNQLVLHTNKTETSLKPNLRLVTINDFHKAMKKTGISVSDSSFVQRELELWNLRYGEGQGSEPTHLPVIHALKAVESGATSLGIKASNGVVIVTEKKLPTTLIDENSVKKIQKLNDGIGVIYSGLGPDYRVLISKARKKSQQYFKQYNEIIPVNIISRKVAGIMQEFTQSGGVRPFGVSLLVAGYDHNGPQLFQVDPSGSFWAWKATAIGKNSSNSKKFLEKRYKPDMEIEDAINTAILTLKEGFEGEMDEFNIEVGVITNDKKFRILEPEEVKDYISELNL
ncbi:aaa-type atpase family protein-related [Anaeramoeba flamelloides]|uniref:Aaa-type atpase family protein-related n=1 Tax=Anaeramoeba flamelloides TaxID=1746091 RepID=A0AAV7Y575_9EUKA|nr:aaa-type atpase family protein-related [Anaeramoeba flamelloides]